MITICGTPASTARPRPGCAAPRARRWRDAGPLRLQADRRGDRPGHLADVPEGGQERAGWIPPRRRVLAQCPGGGQHHPVGHPPGPGRDHTEPDRRER